VGQAARRATQAPGLTRSREGAAAGPPEVIDLEDGPRVGSLTPEWLELAGSFEDSSYFQTPDWVLSWWETVGDRTPTRVAAWRDGAGRLEALVALSRGRERVHRRMPLGVSLYANAGSGAGDADHCGWLVPAGRGDDVRLWLEKAAGDSALLVRSAAPGGPGEVMLPAHARLVATTACPRVALPPGAHPAGPSKSFLRQLRRFERRLAAKGVEFGYVAPGDVEHGLLERLFELHALGREGGNFGADQLGLHRRLADRAGTGRGPAAVTARRGSSIVGVLYGFWWGDTFAAYQSGWDRTYARDGLGNLLIRHALELTASNGARTFDFLRGTEPYKYRFGASDSFDRTWLVPRGAAGMLLAARYRAGSRHDAR
jgi:CelD/BcsL family acetyltransferase involved in cellulose biosynthesis